MQLVGQMYFSDAGFQHDLQRHRIELLQRLFDEPVFFARGDDEQRVVGLVRGDAHVAEGKIVRSAGGLQAAEQRVGAGRRRGGCGARVWQSARLLRRTATAVAWPEGAAEYRGDVRGAAVLHMIDEDAGCRGVAATVEFVHPAAQLIDVGRARRDDQDGIEVIYGDDTYQTRHRPACHHGLKVGRDGAGLRVLQGEQAEGLAAQPIHVEQCNRLRHAREFGAAAADDEKVPLLVRLHDGALGNERFDQMLHVGRRDIAQRHDLHPVAGPSCSAPAAGAGGALQGNDLVTIAVRHQGGAGQAQRILERRQDRVAWQRRCRVQRNIPLHGGRDGVADLQHVAEHGLGDVVYVGVVEIEHVGAAGAAGCGRGPRGGGEAALAMRHVGAPDLWRVERERGSGHRSRTGWPEGCAVVDGQAWDWL